MSVSGQSGEVLSGQTINRLQNEVEKLQAENKALKETLSNIEGYGEKTQAVLDDSRSWVSDVHRILGDEEITDESIEELFGSSGLALVKAVRKYKEE